MSETDETIAYAVKCVRDVRAALSRWKADAMQPGDFALFIEGAEAWCDSITNRLAERAREGEPDRAEASEPRRRSPWDRRQLRIVVEADVDLFDVQAAEIAARPYGIADHIDRVVVDAVAALPGLSDVRSVDTALRDRPASSPASVDGGRS